MGITMNNNRVAIIGLDGVPFNLIERLVNIMPTLAYIYRKGFATTLYSILPPYTPPAWTSIATGVNPGRHGIFDFHIVRKTEERFLSRIATAKDVKYPRIHNMLEMHKMKSIIYNLPLTYPPWAAGDKFSIIINDWMAPEIRIHPKNLEPKYLDYFNKGLEALDLKGSKEESFKIMASRLEYTTQGLLELADHYDWNLLFAVFSETDWSLHDNKKVIKGEISGYATKVFEKIDYFIKQILKRTDNVVIVSDHGFTLCPHITNPLYYLRKCGLIKEHYFSEKIMIDILNRKVVIPKRITAFIRRYKKLKTFMRKALFKIGGKAGRERRREISYIESPVLVPDPGIIYIAPGYKDRIKNILMTIPDIKNVYEAKELYWGPYLDNAPDLILEPVHDYCLGISFKEPRSKPNTAHNRQGVFILYSKDIDSIQYRRIELKLWDVIPVILQILGLPIPHDTDSKLLLRINKTISYMNYTSQYTLWRKIKTIKTYV